MGLSRYIACWDAPLVRIFRDFRRASMSKEHSPFVSRVHRAAARTPLVMWGSSEVPTRKDTSEDLQHQVHRNGDSRSPPSPCSPLAGMDEQSGRVQSRWGHRGSPWGSQCRPQQHLARYQGIGCYLMSKPFGASIARGEIPAYRARRNNPCVSCVIAQGSDLVG